MTRDLQAAIDAVDAAILAGARKVAQRCLDLGYRREELNTVMRPFLRQIAVLRALHVEPYEALLERERLEARQLH